jgi:predicted phosphoribosyltransferase
MFRDRSEAANRLAERLAAYKGQNPLILAIPRGAVPVSPPDTLEKIADMADQVVCLEAPNFFQAVGQFYAHFSQVEDDEVIAILKE